MVTSARTPMHAPPPRVIYCLLGRLVDELSKLNGASLSRHSRKFAGVTDAAKDQVYLNVREKRFIYRANVHEVCYVVN